MSDNQPKHALRTNGDAADVPVEQQRAELAATVEALAAKADVPARVKKTVAADVSKAQDYSRENPQVVAGATGAAVLLVVLVMWLRTRKGRR